MKKLLILCMTFICILSGCGNADSVQNTEQKSGYKQVWLVGEEFAKTECCFKKFHDIEEVKAAIAAQQPQDMYILIKGSNGIKLFQLPELL